MEITSSFQEIPSNPSSDNIEVIVENYSVAPGGPGRLICLDYEKTKLLSPTRYFIELAKICKALQVILPKEIRVYIVCLIPQLSVPPGIYCNLFQSSKSDSFLDIYFPSSNNGDRKMMSTYWDTFDQLYTYPGDKRKDILFLRRYRKNLSRIWNSDTETCFLLPSRNWIYVLPNAQFDLSDKDKVLAMIIWILIIYCIKPDERLYIVSHRMDVCVSGALFLLNMDCRGLRGEAGPPGAGALTWREALLESSQLHPIVQEKLKNSEPSLKMIS